MPMLMIQLREKTWWYKTKRETFCSDVTDEPERMGPRAHVACLALVGSKAQFRQNNGKEDTAWAQMGVWVCGLNCAPNICWRLKPPERVNVNSFGNRALADVMKLKWIHIGLEWPESWPYEKRITGNTKPQTHRKTTMDNRNRNQC